jgi:DNA-binding transcriptional ArsR family regulator
MAGIQRAAPVFAALAHPHRLRIVDHLSHRGPLSVARLTEGSGITRQAISKHLGVLERAGVVHASRRGRERVLELRSLRLGSAGRFLEGVSAEWDGRLDRLRRSVEK